MDSARAWSGCGRAALALLVLSIGAAACGSLSAPATTPSPLPPTETPSPTPRLLLLGVAPESPLGESLQVWAAERGWLTDSFAADAAGLTTGLAQPGVQAVVSLGEVDGLRSAFSGPVVVVHGAEPTADALRSTVGEPGARHDQAAFLAGVLAGLISRAERVALLSGTGGAYEAVYGAAFDHGLRYGCPRCALVRLDVAQATVETVLLAGADAAFAVPGPQAVSALSPLAEAGVWVVWSGTEAAPLPGTQLAGEIRMLPEALAASALTDLVSGQAGRAWPYSLESQSIAVLNLNPEALSPGRERVLREAWESLVSGELQIGVDPLTGAEL